MYGIFILLGAIAINVGFWWLLISFFRKKPKKKPSLIFAAGFVFIVIGGALAPPGEESIKATEDSSKVEEKAEVTPEKTEADVKAEAEAKKKAEEEKAAAEKAEAEQKKTAEKEYYLKEIQPKADTQMGMYDEAWDSLWVTTFNGVSDGGMDVYAAYENMKQLEQRYETLKVSIPAIPSEGLSKENKKTFTEFQDRMVSAARWRASIAQKAQEMFDTGDLSPSKMDEIKSEVAQADNEMISAVVSLTSLEMELGIERE